MPVAFLVVRRCDSSSTLTFSKTIYNLIVAALAHVLAPPIIVVLTIDSECDGSYDGSSYSSSSHFTCVHGVVQFQPNTIYCKVKLLLSHISKQFLLIIIDPSNSLHSQVTGTCDSG